MGDQPKGAAPLAFRTTPVGVDGADRDSDRPDGTGRRVLVRAPAPGRQALDPWLNDGRLTVEPAMVVTGLKSRGAGARRPPQQRLARGTPRPRAPARAGLRRSPGRRGEPSGHPRPTSDRQGADRGRPLSWRGTRRRDRAPRGGAPPPFPQRWSAAEAAAFAASTTRKVPGHREINARPMSRKTARFSSVMRLESATYTNSRNASGRKASAHSARTRRWSTLSEAVPTSTDPRQITP